MSQTWNIVHFNLSVFRWNKNTPQDLNVELVLLFHTLAFCCQLKSWKLLQWSEWFGAAGENRNFEYKEDKAKTWILNLNTKTLENKHFIHYLKRFRRLWPFVSVMPISKQKVSVFLFLSKLSFLVHFQESMRWLFPIQTFISLVIHFPFKWPWQEAKIKQQQNKTTFTATRSQECSTTNRRQPTKLSWGALSPGLCADWQDCITYCIVWHLIGSDQLSYFS